MTRASNLPERHPLEEERAALDREIMEMLAATHKSGWARQEIETECRAVVRSVLDHRPASGQERAVTLCRLVRELVAERIARICLEDRIHALEEALKREVQERRGGTH